MTTAVGPSNLQYALGGVTFLIGLFGTALLYWSARLNSGASALFENYPIGASDAFRSVVRARTTAKRRKLTDLSGDYNVAGTVVLFFALVAGLTINFPIFYWAAIIVALLSIVALVVLRRREPQIDYRLDLFVRSQELIAAARGSVFGVIGDSTLDYVMRTKPETLKKEAAELERLEQEFAHDLEGLRQQIQQFDDDVRAHRRA